MPPKPNHFLAPVEYLYGAYVDRQSQFAPMLSHRHPDYWQIEIAVSGTFQLKLEESTRTLTSGRAVLIPPGTEHLFLYDENWHAFVTVKFRTDLCFHTLPVAEIPPTPTAEFFLRELTRLLRDTPTAFEELTAYTVGALFDHCYRLRENEKPRLIRMINEQLAGGEQLRVKEIAERCGYSRDHLNRVVREHFGMSLKNYLDQELARRARRSLEYSERSISEVASELGFSSIYAFSRFFSRMHDGISPAKFRRLR